MDRWTLRVALVLLWAVTGRAGELDRAREETPSDVRWALEPPREPEFPVSDTQGEAVSAIDHFLLDAMREHDLAFAPEADKRTLLRRVSFDLIGLPPTAAEMQAFLEDEADGAFERVVDRLLASPRYGERWARHWLDVVGFAETEGHEYDPDKPNAFRYRDYVIEAMNGDLPFDRFLFEQIAGDLLADQRLSADGAVKQATIATGVWWLGETQAVPVDFKLSTAIQTERQIDILGKAFLGLTLACARCHDHKFDPVTTRDYYALAGYFHSTRRAQACVDSDQRAREIEEYRVRCRQLGERMAELEGRARIRERRAQLEQVAKLLIVSVGAQGDRGAGDSETADRLERATGRPESECRAWLEHFSSRSVGSESGERADPVFYPWIRLATSGGKRDDFGRQARALGSQLASLAASRDADETTTVFEDFEAEGLDGWERVGAAFRSAPERPPPESSAGCLGRGVASSHGGSDRLIGRLVSRPFRIEKGYIGFWIAGGEDPGKLCLNVTEEGLTYPKLTATGTGQPGFRWRVLDARTFVGREARIELVDESETGYIVVDHIVFSDLEPRPERPPSPLVIQLLARGAVETPEDLAAGYQELLLAALDSAQQRPLDAIRPETIELARWLLVGDHPWRGNEDPLACLTEEERAEYDLAARELGEREGSFPASAIALVSAEASARDAAIEVAGDPHSLGAIVPRGIPRVIDGSGDAADGGDREEAGRGSQRVRLANRLIQRGRGLIARVMVNRIWQHHFGRGLIATPDNFGKLGARATHPELLDYLALRFIESGWSLKAMHRLMLRTRAYRQSSEWTPERRQRDPDNVWLSRMTVRRLEAECVRDQILATAGTLKHRLYGPSVPLHVTPFFEGRDVPARSGPLDGDGRRTIYLEARRNHRMALLAELDFPGCESSVGRRSASVAPGQALSLLNDEFVRAQALAWARAELVESAEKNRPDLVTRMHERALGRPIDGVSHEMLSAFLAAQTARYERTGLEARESAEAAAADLAQVFFNLADFTHVR